MNDDGKLIKVKIQSFTDKKLTKQDQEFKEFEIPINPESFSQNRKIEWETKNSQGSQGTDGKFKSTPPEELKLDFTLDGTGTVEGYVQSLAQKPVSEQVNLFLNTVYFMKGEIHKPKLLKVIWGKHLIFDCLLKNLDINYTLFHPSGEPLRAKLSATFVQYTEQQKRVILQDKRSPDLTHVRQIKGGEKLPLMTYQIYGDQSYYLQVARVNQLTSFRNLEEGREIVFPPIIKNEP